MSRIRHLSGQKYIAIVGDSKSVANTYDYPLLNYLEGRTGNNWGVCLQHALAGRTADSAQSGLAAALAAVTVIPDYCFVNLGTNDSTSMPTQAAFEADYADILDQLQTKWVNAGIFVAKVWRASQVVNCGTLNGYIDNVLATRAWAEVAFDETNWLDAWSLDNVHPDARIGGYSEMARQWFAAMPPFA